MGAEPPRKSDRATRLENREAKIEHNHLNTAV